MEKKIKMVEMNEEGIFTALEDIQAGDPFIIENQRKWIKVDYTIIPKEVFDRYGAKPFEIMRQKMRKGGEVWNNISWNDAKTEAQKLGYRLPSIQETLVLLDWYKHEKGESVSCEDKKFLGIEELSLDEDVCFEWIDAPVPCLRGANWLNGSSAGAFSLRLNWGTGGAGYNVGVRCAR